MTTTTTTHAVRLHPLANMLSSIVIGIQRDRKTSDVLRLQYNLNIPLLGPIYHCYLYKEYGVPSDAIKISRLSLSLSFDDLLRQRSGSLLIDCDLRPRRRAPNNSPGARRFRPLSRR